MKNTEISRRLALAIGYTADRIVCGSHVFVCNYYLEGEYKKRIGRWQLFDHTDPAVIWPIAERFNRFPSASSAGGWAIGWARSEIAATASALAIIRHFESKA